MDIETITAIIKQAEKDLEDANAEGQPYTVKYIEGLEAVIRYLKRYL